MTKLQRRMSHPCGAIVAARWALTEAERSREILGATIGTGHSRALELT